MKIFVLAGEASGDQLGAQLLEQLQRGNPNLNVRGVGGDAMAARGVASLFPMRDLSLMGLAEVVPKIPLLLQRLRKVENEIREFAPDIVITIDVPDFSKRLARRLQDLRQSGKIKLVHYVAPTVWAWRPGRADVMARLFDHVLCLYPFEPGYFHGAGMDATFVGHPVAMRPAMGDAGRLRQKLDIHPDRPVILLLPGSRSGEVKRLWPAFLAAYDLLRQQHPELLALVPGFDHLHYTPNVSGRDDIVFLTDTMDKADAFALAAEQGGAIAASGTVSLELARASCPHMVAYAMHPITFYIAKWLVKLGHVNMINIMADGRVVPELLQGAVTPHALAQTYLSVMADSEAQKNAFAQVMAQLQPPTDQEISKILLQ